MEKKSTHLDKELKHTDSFHSFCSILVLFLFSFCFFRFPNTQLKKKKNFVLAPTIYILLIIPQPTSNIQTGSASRNPSLKTRPVAFQNSFFLNVICEWNKRDINICNSALFLSFKDTVPKEIGPSPYSIFDIHNRLGLQF